MRAPSARASSPTCRPLVWAWSAEPIAEAGGYAVAVGLLLAAGAVVKGLNDRAVPVGADLWILTALPGFGLIRLGKWSRGLIWTALFSAAFYFASTDSPDATQFADYGRYGNVPPAYPRGAEWVLLAVAALLWVTSVAATIWQRRPSLANGA